MFKNKQDADRVVVRNKARLVAQRFCQKEGIDFEETFAPLARLESIRMLLAFVTSRGFKIFQIDVKSAFLNGFIEKVFVRQPLVLKTLSSQTEFLSLKRLCTVLSKLLELGMIV